jgi:hypothetical protein
MNVKNMNKVIAWLEAGAPHAYFDMDYGVQQPNDFEFFGNYTAYKNVEEKENCGTVCCIAGAAALMDYAEEIDYKGVFPKISPEMRWQEVEKRALKYLGLPKDCADFGNELFSPEYAPENCTPQEAAEAMKRVMKGEYPWPEAS